MQLLWMTSVDAITRRCGMQRPWMLASVWTWLSVVRRTNPVCTAMRKAVTQLPTVTTEITTHILKINTAHRPLARQTHGGRSTWECHCTSTASNSPTEIAFVCMLYMLSRHYWIDVMRTSYLRQWNYVMPFVCLSVCMSVCLCVSNFT